MGYLGNCPTFSNVLERACPPRRMTSQVSTEERLLGVHHGILARCVFTSCQISKLASNLCHWNSPPFPPVWRKLHTGILYDSFHLDKDIVKPFSRPSTRGPSCWHWWWCWLSSWCSRWAHQWHPWPPIQFLEASRSWRRWKVPLRTSPRCFVCPTAAASTVCLSFPPEFQVFSSVVLFL